MAVPNWTLVKSELKRRFSDRPQLIEKIGWLLTQKAMNSHQPSWTGGYSPLEYSMGRSLLKPTINLPNFVEMDKLLGRPRINVDYNLISEVTAHCTAENTERMREYLRQLVSTGFDYAGF